MLRVGALGAQPGLHLLLRLAQQSKALLSGSRRVRCVGFRVSKFRASFEHFGFGILTGRRKDATVAQSPTDVVLNMAALRSRLSDSRV